MNSKIEDLRKHLFTTIEALLDKEKPMDIERAKAVSEAAQVVINSAKVEVDFLKVTQRETGTGFFPDGSNELPAASGEPKKLTQAPKTEKKERLPSSRPNVECEHPGDKCKGSCGCVCRPCLDVFLEKE